MKKILVIGGGAWGTALAIKASNNNWFVDIAIRNKDCCKKFNLERESKYLPSIILNENIKFITFDVANAQTLLYEYVIISTPSHVFSEIINKFSFSLNSKILVATKGLDHDKNSFLSRSLSEVFKGEIAFLSGPNFAREVAMNIESASLISSSKLEIASEFAGIFHSKDFFIYIDNDIISNQISGIYKNILAIYFGYITYFNYGENFKAKTIYDGIKEMGIISKNFGGNAEKIFNIATIGDTILSCYSSKSRNFLYGQHIAKNIKFDKLIYNVEENASVRKKNEEKDFSFLVEGVKSAITLSKVCNNFIDELILLQKMLSIIT